ncbi:interferon-induced, double-stranded RNA-activated protein kinase-like [Neolamprologus brichardi]|uniref:interferon-induced, double-stranded RNA-activated protein kinase-like n=1 Tax=Neolamprologus brichardi TaxID=32507 RepID=UPI001643DF55|nr:interferon-induced, double-stranded RNA-activated protein kinase-like [Neolamprologus brichardi]
MATVNYVGKLNEYANTRKFEVSYEEIRSDGPPHDKVFYLRAVIDGKAYPSGEGKTKKEAKQNAAKNALQSLSQLGHQDSVESRNNAAEASDQMVLSSKDTSFTETDFKSLVNRYCQKTKCSHSYVEVKKDGPSHIPHFIYKLIIDNKEYPVGEGKSIMEAQQKAAELAWSALQEQPDWDSKRNNEAEASDQTVLSSEDTSFTETDFKSLVNRYCQKTKCSHSYVEVKKDGPSHIPHYIYKLIIDDKEYPVGEGNSIKKAQQKAAELACSVLQEQSDWDIKVSFRPTASEDGAPPESLASSVTQFTSEFEPLKRLGKGGFGSVYKVRHKQLKIEYAVKVGCYKEKSLREVRALSDLFHRNIVRYYTFWMQDTGYEWDLRGDSYDSYASSHHEGNSESKFLYIQMELCSENTLRDWIDEKNKESVQDSKRREESLRIAQEIVCGVEYIHSKNHIHRDLKPANIMFGVEGEVKIGDFGLVTSDDDDEERTVCKGTPSYMAPEQRSERKYDRKVDMFALGLIFFELLWKLSTGSERAKIWPDVRRQRFPEDFSVTFTKEKQIINSLLSEKSEDRPDASAVKAELEEWTQIFNSHKASRQENQTV